MLRLVPVFFAVVLGGCASTKTVEFDRSSVGGNGVTIASTLRERPDFSAFTAGKAAFGLFGAAAMISSGNRIVRENEVEDPANYIAKKLLEDLETNDGISPVSTKDTLVRGADIKKMSELYKDARLLLDVQTVNWSFAYFPTDFNNYRVIYSAKVRLIDTQRMKVLAEGFCSRVPEKSPESPSYDQLLENKAARLKQELATAADYCLGEFRNKVLKVPNKAETSPKTVALDPREESR